MMNNIKKLTVLFLSIIFSLFVIVAFDNASSAEASECSGDVTSNMCVTLNDGIDLNYKDSIGNEYNYGNVFASLSNLKIDIKALSSTNIEYFRYKLRYGDYVSSESSNIKIDGTKSVIVDVAKAFSAEDKGIVFNEFDTIYVDIKFCLGMMGLNGEVASGTYSAVYKPLTTNDISLYSEGGISKYQYKVDNVAVYGQTVQSNSNITISVYKKLNSGTLTLVKSPYSVSLENYSYLINLGRFDGTFLIKVGIDSINGIVEVEREFSCDLTAPTVKIEDITLKVASSNIRVTETGVSNVRAFNLTTNEGKMYYRVLNYTLPQPSTSNLENDWVEYSGRGSNSVADVLLDSLSDGKYYLYLVAKDGAGNYSKIERSEPFIIDNSAPVVNEVNVSLDVVNEEIMVSVKAEDISSISKYVARYGYYDENGTVHYGEWVEQSKYAFRLDVSSVTVGNEIFVEVYAVDGLLNCDETAYQSSETVKAESRMMSVSYESISNEYIREHGEVFTSTVYLNIRGENVASIKINGAEYINNPQVCSKEVDGSYRCKFAIDGEYSVVVSNESKSDVIKRTFIINTHGGILVDSIKVEDYKKYFMASIVKRNGKYIVTIPNSVYDVEQNVRFIYVAANGSYKHLLDEDKKVEVSFKDVEMPTYKNYVEVEVPMNDEQYTSLKYSQAFETNYILCYTVEAEEIGTVIPEEPEVPETPNEGENGDNTGNEGTLPPVEDDNNNDNVENKEPVVVNKNKSNSKISVSDMLKIFILAAAIILFVKIINYRKNVKVL